MLTVQTYNVLLALNRWYSCALVSYYCIVMNTVFKFTCRCIQCSLYLSSFITEQVIYAVCIEFIHRGLITNDIMCITFHINKHYLPVHTFPIAVWLKFIYSLSMWTISRKEFMTDQSARLRRRDAIRVVDIQRTSLLLITKRLHPSPPRCRGLIEGAISVYPIPREC